MALSGSRPPNLESPPELGTSPERIRWRVVILAFAVLTLDGFDAAALAFVVPVLSKEWDVAPAAFTTPLVATNLAVVTGYLLSGWLASRIGARNLLVLGALLFGLGSLATVVILGDESLTELTLLRLVTGLGLGVVLPAAVSCAVDNAPPNRRTFAALLATTGMPLGATIGGFLGGSILRITGVPGLFVLAGVLPILLAPLLFWGIARTRVAVSRAAETQEARWSRVFAPSLRVSTLLLLVFAFVIFLANYTVLTWIPSLLVEFGFAATDAPLGVAFFSLGGVVGVIALIPLVHRLGPALALTLTSTVGAVFLLLAAALPLSHGMVLALLAVAGSGVTAGLAGLSATAVPLYPRATLPTGLGLAVAVGRAGSILGPAVGGLLLALGLSGRSILMLTVVPIAAAGVIAGLMYQRVRMQRDDRVTKIGEVNRNGSVSTRG